MQVRCRLTILESRIRSTPGDGTSAEQAAKHLGCESVKTFEKIAVREGIPKHYLSARAPRYNRAELDAWLLGRRQGGVSG
jgi:hypothetical protein